MLKRREFLSSVVAATGMAALDLARRRKGWIQPIRISASAPPDRSSASGAMARCAPPPICV